MAGLRSNALVLDARGGRLPPPLTDTDMCQHNMIRGRAGRRSLVTTLVPVRPVNHWFPSFIPSTADGPVLAWSRLVWSGVACTTEDGYLPTYTAIDYLGVDIGEMRLVS